MECEKHRTISLMSQLRKVIVREIMVRTKRKIQENLDEKSICFRKGKRTRNAIFILRMILEKAVAAQKDIHIYATLTSKSCLIR